MYRGRNSPNPALKRMKKQYPDAVKVSIPQICSMMTERTLKILEILDANLDLDIKLKMIKRELEQTRYEGFKVCQVLPKEMLGKRTKTYIYKPKWSFWKGNKK